MKGYDEIKEEVAISLVVWMAALIVVSFWIDKW